MFDDGISTLTIYTLMRDGAITTRMQFFFDNVLSTHPNQTVAILMVLTPKPVETWYYNETIIGHCIPTATLVYLVQWCNC